MPHTIPTVTLAWLLFTSTLWGQLAVFGDLYLNGNTQLHIAFDQTYFSGGKLRTDPTPSADAVLSFGPQSKWEQLKSDSYVVGKVRIYHEGTFTFPIGSEDRFSPITFEVFQNTGFIQTQYTETPPALLTQFEVPFTPPLYHYWSWEITGEAIARLRAYWTEQHRLDRLSFDPIDPTELQLGLYVNSTWQFVLGHHSSNPFLPDLPLSIANGSILLLEPIPLETAKGLSFTVPKTHPALTEKIVSQVITPNNDGIHDGWKIKGYVFTPESIIKIYNLAGSLVFQHQGEYANDWEGTAASNGERLPQGSYYYTLDLDGNHLVDVEGWILIKYR